MKETIEKILNTDLAFLEKLSKSEQVKLQQAILASLPSQEIASPSRDRQDSIFCQFSEQDAHLLLRALLSFPDDAINDLGIRLLRSSGMERLDQAFQDSIQIHENKSLIPPKFLIFADNFFYKRTPKNSISLF